MSEQDRQQRTKLADHWKFTWPVLDVLIGGNSSIDLPNLSIRNWEEAGKFIGSYGFDCENSQHQRKIHGAIIESLSFIERSLMPKEWARGLTPPIDVVMCHDARNLILWASDITPEHRDRRNWSCAVLRVMHTIFHIEGAFRYSSIDQARDQIMNCFRKFIFATSDGKTWFGKEGQKVELDHADWKNLKARQSILLKLLHKRANVAETIYDMIGIRIVTKRQSDVMQLIKYLHQFHILSFPNCSPARARNTLMDASEYRRALDDLRGRLLSGSITPEQFEMTANNLRVKTPEADSSNPHSAKSYHSIQMTGRQLIRAPNANLGWLIKLEKNLHTLPENQQRDIQSLLSYIKTWPGMDLEIETSAFFPFELQVMDLQAWQYNSSGAAAHGKYKRSQIKAARRRVLSDVLQLDSTP